MVLSRILVFLRVWATRAAETPIFPKENKRFSKGSISSKFMEFLEIHEMSGKSWNYTELYRFHGYWWFRVKIVLFCTHAKHQYFLCFFIGPGALFRAGHLGIIKIWEFHGISLKVLDFSIFIEICIIPCISSFLPPCGAPRAETSIKPKEYQRFGRGPDHQNHRFPQILHNFH